MKNSPSVSQRIGKMRYLLRNLPSDAVFADDGQGRVLTGQAELFAGGKPKHLAHGGEVSDLIGRLNVEVKISQNDFRDADAA